MRFCEECGEPLEDGVLFCSSCGAKVESEGFEDVEPGNFESNEPGGFEDNEDNEGSVLVKDFKEEKSEISGHSDDNLSVNSDFVKENNNVKSSKPSNENYNKPKKKNRVPLIACITGFLVLVISAVVLVIIYKPDIYYRIMGKKANQVSTNATDNLTVSSSSQNDDQSEEVSSEDSSGSGEISDEESSSSDEETDEDTSKEEEETEPTPERNPTDDTYLFKKSDKKYLDAYDIYHLPKKKVQLAINEIYARHGYIFGDNKYSKIFMNKTWYEPTVSPDDFDESVFNKYEKMNIVTLGCRREGVVSPVDWINDYYETAFGFGLSVNRVDLNGIYYSIIDTDGSSSEEIYAKFEDDYGKAYDSKNDQYLYFYYISTGYGNIVTYYYDDYLGEYARDLYFEGYEPQLAN
ncbi:MAG: YARHG domain-containing protein [Lachnospiraceae bacterium]|nr:YARHG domain-containing protein [Lachnospiraceae bacterium]